MIKSRIVIISIISAVFISCTDHLVERGNKNLSLGDYQRATHLFSKAVDRNPENFNARIGLGKAILQQLAATNQTDELWNACLTNLEAARTLKPDASIEKLLSIAWNQRGTYLFESKDSTRALQSFLKSIEYDKKNINSLNQAGILYFNKGDRQKAITLFTLVTHLDTLSPTGYFNAGMVSWSAGDCRNARKAWLGALQRFPDNQDLLYWAAMAEKTCFEKD